MLALLIFALSCVSASPVAKPESDADPYLFYQPHYNNPVYYQPRQPYYYPAQSYHYPSYVPYYQPQVRYEVKQEVAQVEPVKKYPIRAIIPVFDVLRSGHTQVSFLRPEEIKPAVPQQEDDPKIISYGHPVVPYTQAYLNRIPISRRYGY